MLGIGKIIGKFVKNSSQRELDRLRSIVKKINEAGYRKLILFFTALGGIAILFN